LNVLDFAIILTVSVLVMVGFFAGVGRVAAGFLAFYLSTIVAATFYDELAVVFTRFVNGMRDVTSELLAFLLIFIVLTAGFMWAIGVTIKAVEVRRGRLAILNNVGGAALAVIAGTLAIAVTLTVSVVILGAFNQASVQGGSEGLGAFGRQIRGSELVPVFLKLQDPITQTFEPWFPDGLPPVLQPEATARGG
jgi:hypothetical protein